MEKKTTEFESLSPNLIVKDVNRSVDFYVNQLGFVMLFSVPDKGTFNWAMVQRGNVTLMFQTLESIKEDLPSLDIKQEGRAGTFYIKVKGLDALMEAVEGKVKMAVELRTTFYGAREFAVKDPDGYILMFAEDAK